MTRTPPQDLAALEREAFRKFFEDGLLDIFLGLLLATMPLGTLVDDLVVAAINGVLVVVLIVVRFRVVRPRLGRMTPGPRRRQKVRRGHLALVASVVLGLVVWGVFAAGAGEGILRFMPFVWLVNCVVVFGAMAHFLDVPRFLLYGFLYGVPLAIDGIVRSSGAGRLPLLVTFVLPALVIVGVGVAKLLRFLRDYPLRGREVEDGAL